MPASAAQVAANRRNSARSTGPKTPEGKARTRHNALKHGMRAESIVVLGDDPDRVKARYVNLHAQLRPSDELGEVLVDEVAFQSIRLERCRRFDTMSLRDRTRNAEANFDDARLAKVEELAQSLDCRSATATRRLQAMPEGIDYLLVQWDDLRADLTDPERPRWSYNHLARTRYLRGIEPSTVRDSREYTLTEVMGGFFANMDPRDAEGLETDAAKVEFARLELLTIFDAEIARLEDARTKLDHGRIAEERAESVDLALFDDSKEATLARKYEAAALRAMYKAIDEFREAEATALEPVEVDANADEDSTSGELASFGQIGEQESDPEAGPVEAAGFPGDPVPIAAVDSPAAAIPARGMG